MNHFLIWLVNPKIASFSIFLSMFWRLQLNAVSITIVITYSYIFPILYLYLMCIAAIFLLFFNIFKFFNFLVFFSCHWIFGRENFYLLHMSVPLFSFYFSFRRAIYHVFLYLKCVSSLLFRISVSFISSSFSNPLFLSASFAVLLFFSILFLVLFFFFFLFSFFFISLF